MLHASSFPVRNGNPRDPSVWVRYFAGAFFRPGAVPGTLPYGSILGNRWVAFAPFWESVLEVPVLNVFVVAAIALCRKPVEPPAYLVTMGLMGGAFILGAVSLSQGDWMLRVFLTGVWGLACGAFLAPAHVEATQEEKSILRPVLTFFALARLFPFMFSPALPPEWVPTVSAFLPSLSLTA